MSLPKVETKYAENYKEIFVNRVIGGMREGYFEVELVAESSNFEPAMKVANFDFAQTTLKRTIHAKILVPAISFRDTVTFFQQQLTNYENTFGKIPTLDTIQEGKASKTNSSSPSFIG